MELPSPMTTQWLAAYMEMHQPAPLDVVEEHLPPEEGGPSGLCSLLHWSEKPDVYEPQLLRRAGPFTSKLVCAESKSVEREYRFHRELASLVVAGPEVGLLKPKVAPPDKDAFVNLVREVRNEPDVEGVFQVVHRRVVVRDLPKYESMQLKTLRKGDKVRGMLREFSSQAWVELTGFCKEQLGLDKERPAYVEMNGDRLGLGDLLRRTNEAPSPETDHWRRPAAAFQMPLPEDPKPPKEPPPEDRSVESAVAVEKPPKPPKAPDDSDSDSESSSDDEAAALAAEGFMAAHLKWTRICEILLNRSADREGKWLLLVGNLLDSRRIRVPWCKASYWAHDAPNEAWKSFLLVLERLGEPDWFTVDSSRLCCTDLQARTSVEALANMHREFRGRRFLDAHSWLPLTPLGLENPHQVTQQLSGCYHDLLYAGEIQTVLSPLVLEAVERLCSIEAYSPEAIGRLTKPPLTLLHGDYHPGLRPHGLAWTGLRYSTREPPAVAALDWSWVCCGRAAYDLATFMALGLDVEDRREWETWILMLYGEAAGARSGAQARIDFDEDFRAGLLAVLAFYLLRNAGALTTSGQADPANLQAVLLGLYRIGVAIEDWECMNLLGGSELARQRAEQNEARKRAERIADRKRAEEEKPVSTKRRLSALDKLKSANAGSGSPKNPTSASRSKSPDKKGKAKSKSPQRK